MARAKSQVGKLPLYYTEYNDGLYGSPPYHDSSYAAAFIAKNVHDVNVGSFKQPSEVSERKWGMEGVCGSLVLVDFLGHL